MEQLFDIMAWVFITFGAILIIVTCSGIYKMGWTDRTLNYIKSSALLFIAAAVLHAFAS